jgi:PAS domain S-box-containing protein
MVMVTTAGEIVLVNRQAERQFGYPRDELIGQDVTIIIPEGLTGSFAAGRGGGGQEALGEGETWGIELSGRRKGGGRFPIDVQLGPLRGAEGILVAAAIRDITARKKAEEQLDQKIQELNRSNAELDKFASVASHDLQEPLRMVASYTQLLARRYKGRLDADADEFIAYAVDGANRMQQLIQDMLAYSRTGTPGTKLRPVSAEAALAHALLSLRGAVEQSGAIVTHDKLPVVLGDQVQITQLFQNLLSNAIKYQHGTIPRIEVSATIGDGGMWLFSVKDNGIGIDPKYYDRIFGIFQRLHKREEYAGTGMGLAICKKIVEGHGGRIRVSSRLGEGSTFSFTLQQAGDQNDIDQGGRRRPAGFAGRG